MNGNQKQCDTNIIISISIRKTARKGGTRNYVEYVKRLSLGRTTTVTYKTSFRTCVCVYPRMYGRVYECAALFVWLAHKNTIQQNVGQIHSRQHHHSLRQLCI